MRCAGRWVVIELKAGRVDDGALHQALYYASSLARLSAEELRAKLESNLNRFGDAGVLSARLRQLLDSEADGGPREVAVALVGVGIFCRTRAHAGVPGPLEPVDRRRQLQRVRAGRRPQAADS